ncbi:hypothetical protein F5B19DRAFT_384852 [Rostrohypoxylon terebratum]|nr:hypothetical protein F5B19DRAFT_384852 [Rostrohypoxylon terebratum]
MAGDKWPTDRTQGMAESSQGTDEQKSTSRWKRILSSVKSIGKSGGSGKGKDKGKGKEKEESTQSTPPILPKVADTLKVETIPVTFPPPIVFRHPRSPFAPGNNTFNSRSPASSSTETPKTAEFNFKWVPQTLLAVSDVKDPEAQSRVQHVITRAELDDRKVSPQEAYDALRMANGVVNDAYGMIKRGETFFSSGEDDPKPRQSPQDPNVPPTDAPKKKKKVSFNDDITYIDPLDHPDES